VQDREQFDELVLPHLRAAFNLARWLLRSREDAEDVTQEALLRAFRFFGGFRGADARAWLLQIVRNTCYTWMEKNSSMSSSVEFDESLHLSPVPGPEAQAVSGSERERLGKALEQLSPRSREVIVLRELEGCSYKEIAAITAMPMGTVMSTLARARERLQELLGPQVRKEAVRDL
jgi:RNA polymerase sigma-70 factor, ECF subfamily